MDFLFFKSVFVHLFLKFSLMGNVTVAYAIRHLKYLSDWCLFEIDNRWIKKKGELPIGTCVEGIRVEFTTPGYKNATILAIANIKNSKYQTNVARSALELVEHKINI